MSIVFVGFTRIRYLIHSGLLNFSSFGVARHLKVPWFVFGSCLMVHECVSTTLCLTLTYIIDILVWKYCVHIAAENSVETKIFGSWVRNPNSNWHRPKTCKIVKKRSKMKLSVAGLGGLSDHKKGVTFVAGSVFWSGWLVSMPASLAPRTLGRPAQAPAAPE